MCSVCALVADCHLAIDPDGIWYFFSGSIASMNSVVYFCYIVSLLSLLLGCHDLVCFCLSLYGPLIVQRMAGETGQETAVGLLKPSHFSRHWCD